MRDATRSTTFYTNPLRERGQGERKHNFGNNGRTDGNGTGPVSYTHLDVYKRQVLGFVADKDLSKVLPLLPKEAHYIFTRAGIERALDENILARRAAE